MSKLKTIGIVIAITAGLIIVLNLFVGWFVDRTLEKRRYYANSTRGEFRYRLANYENFPGLKSILKSFIVWTLCTRHTLAGEEPLLRVKRLPLIKRVFALILPVT